MLLEMIKTYPANFGSSFGVTIFLVGRETESSPPTLFHHGSRCGEGGQNFLQRANRKAKRFSLVHILACIRRQSENAEQWYCDTSTRTMDKSSHNEATNSDTIPMSSSQNKINPTILASNRYTQDTIKLDASLEIRDRSRAASTRPTCLGTWRRRSQRHGKGRQEDPGGEWGRSRRTSQQVWSAQLRRSQYA